MPVSQVILARTAVPDLTETPTGGHRGKTAAVATVSTYSPGLSRTKKWPPVLVRALKVKPVRAERARSSASPSGRGRHAWSADSTGQVGPAWTIPKITPVAAAGRVVAGPEAAGTAAPAVRDPQAAVTTTTAAASTRPRQVPIGRVVVTMLRRQAWASGSRKIGASRGSAPARRPFKCQLRGSCDLPSASRGPPSTRTDQRPATPVFRA
jgi:hypothetical protein